MAHDELGNLYAELFRSRFAFVPSGEHRLRDIYALVKTSFPSMCDDTYTCRDHCSSHDPGAEWKHRVRSALNDLRQLSDPPVRRGSERGAWVISGGDAASILYFHGLGSGVGSLKWSALNRHFQSRSPKIAVIDLELEHSGRNIREIASANMSYALDRVGGMLRRSIDIARAAIQKNEPRIIVGSSLGGAVGMAASGGKIPMVLVAPVWSAAVQAVGLIDAMSGEGSGDALSHLGPLKIAADGVANLLCDEIFRSEIPTKLPPATIILHSINDRLVGWQESLRLLQKNPIPTDNHPMVSLVEQLAKEGFCDSPSPFHAEASKDRRLVLIGKDHQCNDPDPDDPRRRHPHDAMNRAAELLLSVSE